MSDLRDRLERAFDFAAKQTRALVERAPNFLPIYTSGGRWAHGGELWTDWCAGFLVGILWKVAERTKDPWFRQKAEDYSKLLEHKKHDRAVHDLGFIFLNSYLPWYENAGDPKLLDVLVEAGRTLALRFQPRGRYLCSFLGSESLFIDIMMNVAIVFLAAHESKDDRLAEIAAAHCRTTERYLVRADGSTAHEGIFDVETGGFLHESTRQGLRADSTWSRGLAWSLHGFGTVYTYTRDPFHLAVAARNADCFLKRLGECERPVPPWDFDAPLGPERLDDSSAGAIAASGLWKLADLIDDNERAKRYRSGALSILDALCTDRYVAWNDLNYEGILKHGVYHLHKKLGVDESVMWGEYFFVEAISRVLEANKDVSETKS